MQDFVSAVVATAQSRLPGALAGSPAIDTAHLSLRTNEVRRFRLGVTPESVVGENRALKLQTDTLGSFLGTQQAHLFAGARGQTAEVIVTPSWSTDRWNGWMVDLSYSFGLSAPKLTASFEDSWAYLRQLDLRVYESQARARMLSQLEQVEGASSLSTVIRNVVELLVKSATTLESLRDEYKLPAATLETVRRVREDNEPRLRTFYRLLQDSVASTQFDAFADPAFFRTAKASVVRTILAALSGDYGGSDSDFFSNVISLANEFALVYLPSSAEFPVGRLSHFGNMVDGVQGSVVLPSDAISAHVDGGRRPTRAVTIAAPFTGFHRGMGDKASQAGIYSTFNSKILVAYPERIDTGSQGAVPVNHPSWLPMGELLIPREFLDIQTNAAGLELDVVRDQLQRQIAQSERCAAWYLKALRWFARMKYTELQLSRASVRVNLPLEAVDQLRVGLRYTLLGEDQKPLGRGTVVSMEVSASGAESPSAQCLVGFGYCEFNGYTFDQ